MGLLDKLFKTKPDYPPLDDDSKPAEQIRRLESELSSLAESVSEDIEVVPDDDETYVFIGKPPKVFGLAWIREGQVSNMVKVVEEQGVAPHRVEALVELIRTAYERSQNDDRYMAEVAGRSMVITPSHELRRKVHELVHRVIA